MSNKSVDAEFQNEKEWRRYQMQRFDSLDAKIDKKLSSIEMRMTQIEILGATLKIKIGWIAGIFSTISATVVSAIVSIFLNKNH